jgi:2-iminobutanoate/2-iminopropanoate deaminase
MKIIKTDLAPEAVGPYSQAVQTGNLIFLSGQIPIDPKTQEMCLFDGDVTKQAELVISNIKGVLKSQNLTLNSVVKATIFLADLNDFAAVNAVYSAAFGDHRPARSTFQVAGLPKGASVEIETIATLEA